MSLTSMVHIGLDNVLTFCNTGFEGNTHIIKVEKQTAVSCQATEPDLSSVAALISVLHTTDMSRAFNFPLKCPGTTEGRGGSV